jgi:hypothetical protein
VSEKEITVRDTWLTVNNVGLGAQGGICRIDGWGWFLRIDGWGWFLRIDGWGRFLGHQPLDGHLFGSENRIQD